MVKHPFSVRKMSGRGGVKYVVVLNPGQRRVSVHAHVTKDTAWIDADQLNIGALVRDHAEDPRPYEIRLAEATAAYIRPTKK